MKITSPYPSYWRANALDNFTGSAWVTSQAFTRRLTAELDNGAYVYLVPAYDPTPGGKTITEEFSLDKSISTNYLFIGGEPQSISLDQEIAPRLNDMRSIRVSTPLASSVDYSVSAVIPQVQPKQLVGLGRDYPDEIAAYLTLPFTRLADLEGSDKDAAWRASLSENAPGSEDWLELYSLNERIVREATDPYQIALRLEQYLRRFYSYSLTPPPSDYSSPYAAFLFDTRSGYCQHFAGAMALLLRYNGIPSRVAVGFTAGEEVKNGIYQVTTNNAHAWVEVYFPTVGWVTFDPTPGRNVPFAGASSTSPGFVNPYSGPATPGDTTVTTAPPRDVSETTPTTGKVPQATGASWLSRATWLPWVLGLVVIVAGWPFAREAWRRRGLHRGTYDKRLQASLRTPAGRSARFRGSLDSRADTRRGGRGHPSPRGSAARTRSRRTRRGDPLRGPQGPASGPRSGRVVQTFGAGPAAQAPWMAARGFRLVRRAANALLRYNALRENRGDNNQKGQEAACLRPQALQALWHLHPFLPRGRTGGTRRRHSGAQVPREVHLVRHVRRHVP